MRAIFTFLRDVLKAGEHYPKLGWTGFRILGTVNRANGFTVWHLQLFSKHPKSKTKVYSGDFAPNVRPDERAYNPMRED